MERTFNIVSLFLRQARAMPDKIAIVEDELSISFGELCRQVEETAAYFVRKGIKQGDRVLVFVPMGIDLYRTVLALFYIGAIAVFVDEWADRKRLDKCCAIADCKAFIGVWKAHLLRLLSKEIRNIPIKLTTAYSGKGSVTTTETSPDETALITFTTGSTGTPKAAVRTHGFLLEQFRALEEKLDAKPTDVDMSVLPIVLLINLAVGSTSVIAYFKSGKPLAMKVDKIIGQLQRYHVSRLVASPYFIKRIAQAVITNKTCLPHLQDIFTGGAPVYQSEAKLYMQAFEGKNIQIVYGSTEAEPISSVRAEELGTGDFASYRDEGLLVGKPYQKTTVRIIKISDRDLFCISAAEFEAMICAEGVWGEIVVSGSHVLAQYYKNETALRSNKIYIDGVYWHRTRDAGYLREGNLYLVGRCRTLIPKEDGYISPFVFENYVQSIPGVEAGTLLQIDKIDDTLMVLIELADTQADKESIRDTILRLPLPIETVRFVRLPRDPRHHSKIDYEKLAIGVKTP